MSQSLRATYIGGPTALLEIAGMGFLTDPTFDSPGGDYVSPATTLHKLTGPALLPSQLGKIDAVLLSHDHHWDNLDRSGRGLLKTANKIITTEEGAGRLEKDLNAAAAGLSPWESLELSADNSHRLRVTSTPAQHGPAHLSRGAVTGFVLSFPDPSLGGIYISGDTVWFDGVQQVAERFDIRVAFLFLGAAQVKEVGPWHLTMSAADAVRSAHAFASAKIVPLHYEGWAHFTQSRAEVDKVFADASLLNRLLWLDPGRPTEILFSS